MADPIVTITNGVPTSSVPASGVITTLGQTLVDGANATLGATTDAAIVAGAAGTINAHLRSISRDLTGGIVLQAGGNSIGNVGQGGAPWTQNITQWGGVAVTSGVGVGGPGIPRVTVSSDSSLAATQSGTWNIASITGAQTLPTGASTSAKQPALGTAGTPSADVITVQGVSSMTPLKVDGTGGSFPVTGTITANQGGTWNITNISGSVSLPTGAATSAKQPAPSTAGSPSADVLTVQGASAMTPLKTNLFGNAGAVLDFAGQNFAGTISSLLVGGQFNTTPTTIVSGNFSPLQLDAAGNLLVNVKAGGGAGGGTSSNFAAAFPAAGTAAGAEYLSTPPTLTSGQMVALQTDASGNLKVNIQAGAGSGGTASSVGGALPGQGTLALGSVTTAAPSYTTATANSLSLDTSGNLRTSVNNTVAVTGTFWQATQPVSGTVTANQGGAPWTVKPDGTAWAMTGTSANVNVTNTVAVSGTFWQATQPVSGTVTVQQATAANLQATVTGTVAATQSGAWNITNITGTVSLPTGAATAVNQATPAASASTTSGQTGYIAMGATTTGVPAYTTGQTNPLSLTTTGGLRVDGSATVQPVSQSGTWNITNITGTVTVAGTVSAAQSGIWSARIIGSTGNIMDFAGQNAAQPAAALLIGGEFNTTPTTIASGNASPLQLDSSGNLKISTPAVVTTGTSWNSSTAVNTTLAIQNNPSVNGQVTVTTTITGGAIAFEESYDNGTTWYSTPSARLINPVTGAQIANPYTLVANTNLPFELVTTGTTQYRIRLSTVIAGTGTASFVVTSSPLVNEVQVSQTNPLNLAAAVSGDIASGATDANNPIKIGGLAKTTQPTAVADGQRVAATFDKQGRQIVVGHARQLKGVQTTTITTTTETTIVTAGAAGIFNDLYGLIIANTSASTVSVTVKDATAGTTRFTIEVPATDTRGFTLTVDSAVPQAVAASNWTATLSGAVTSVFITALYAQNT